MLPTHPATANNATLTSWQRFTYQVVGERRILTGFRDGPVKPREFAKVLPADGTEGSGPDI
jgi:hypothetical protein